MMDIRTKETMLEEKVNGFSMDVDTRFSDLLNLVEEVEQGADQKVKDLDVK